MRLPAAFFMGEVAARMKKTPVIGLLKSREKSEIPIRSWHNGGETEIRFYARSLQNAARTLIGKPEPKPSARPDWDVCPVVLLYRQALEIHLKMLVGDGSNFLRNRTDPISLSTTHSLRWLAQIVCQIIRAVGWENNFTCGGVSSLADFSALVNEVESFDPITRAIRSSTAGGANSVSQYYREFDVVRFANNLDALLDLLNSTAEALAATWDQRAAFEGADDLQSWIQ
jgi:hypothetical protein